MSEKRLIDIDELIVIAFNAESRNDIEEEFKKLPKPILPDVTGTRTLDSMTEEERIELSRIVSLPPSTSKSNLPSIIYGWIEEDILRFSIAKWLLEKGFSVFGEKK